MKKGCMFGFIFGVIIIFMVVYPIVKGVNTITQDLEGKSPYLAVGYYASDDESIVHPAVRKTMLVGDTLRLNAVAGNTNDTTIIYTSGDQAICSVHADGVLEAKKAGITTIFIHTKEGTLQSEFHVDVSKPIKSIQFEKEVTLKMGEVYTPKVQVNPVNGNVVWYSTDESVVRLDTNGKLHAYGVGSSTIQVLYGHSFVTNISEYAESNPIKDARIGLGTFKVNVTK